MPAIHARDVATAFYQAFERKDGAAMAAAYAPNAKFSDPVFTDLEGNEAGSMWKMLTKSKDLKLTTEIVGVEGDTVTAKWVAQYAFPATGRRVENHITSKLTIKDGKIVEHTDAFDMDAWLRQAYGMAAALPLAGHVLTGVTRHFAERQLRSFMADGG